MVTQTPSVQGAAAAAPSPALGLGEGQADGSNNLSTEAFWSTTNGPNAQQIKFAVAAPRQLPHELKRMAVSYACAKVGQPRPLPDKFITHPMVLNREGDAYVSAWVPLAADESAETAVWYTYKVWVKFPLIGNYEYPENTIRHVRVGAGKRMRLFTLLHSSCDWVFANPQYTVTKEVQGRTAPLSEQLETLSRLLVAAPSLPRWLQAAAGLVQARAKVDEAPLEHGLRVVVQGLLHRATPRQQADRLFQATVLLLAGAGGESLGLEAGTCCGALLSQVAEETLTGLDHEGEARDLVWRGLRVLAGHNMRAERDYAWLPLLLWRCGAALPKGGARGVGLEMGPGSADIDGHFVARAMHITDSAESHRCWEVVEVLLSHAPSSAAAWGLLLHVFGVLPVGPGPRDVALLRHMPLPHLIAEMGQPVPDRLWAAVRGAVVERGRREAVDATSFDQAVRWLGLQGEEIRPLLTAMLEHPHTATDALPAMLAPHVMAQVSHMETLMRDVVRKWFGRGVDRAMASGEHMAVCVANVVVQGRSLLTAADPSLTTQLHTCALNRLKTLSPREVLQSVGPLARCVAAHEAQGQGGVGALLWEHWLAGALKTCVTPPSPDSLLSAVEAMGLGGAHEGLGAWAVDLLAELVEGRAHEETGVAHLLEYADAAAALLRLRGRVWAALKDQSMGAGGRLVGRVRGLLQTFEDGSISLRQLQTVTRCPRFAARLATYSLALGACLFEWPCRHEAWFVEAEQAASRLRETMDQLGGFLATYTEGTVRRVEERGDGGKEEKKGETQPEEGEDGELWDEEEEGEEGEEDEEEGLEGDTWRACDVGGYEAALRELTARVPDLSLKGAQDMLTQDGERAGQWGLLSTLRGPAAQLYPLSRSRLVRNAWDLSVSQWLHESREGERLTVATLARDGPPVALTRLADFLGHCQAPPPSLTLSCLAEMLHGLEAQGLQAELTGLHTARLVTSTHCDVMGAHGCLDAFLRLPELCTYARAVKGLANVLDSSGSEPMLAAAAGVERLGDVEGWAHLSAIELMAAVQEFQGRLGSVWDAMPLLGELGNCPTLLSLVQRMLNEDALFLINAVEEHGEAALRADTVSSFDDVRQLLGPVLRGEGERLPGECGLLAGFRCLRERALGQGDGGDTQACLHRMAVRARMCALHAHALQDLYENVANREELTKATVARLLESGHFLFTITPADPIAHISLSATCQGADGKDQVFVQARLEDLRGRALLQVNHTSSLTPRQQEEQQAQWSQDCARLRRFIDATQRALATARQLSALSEMGHLDYRSYSSEVRVCPAAMETAEAAVRQHHDAWASQLQHLRSTHHYLNYLGCAQLGLVSDFLGGAHPAAADETREALEVLRFVCPGEMCVSKALAWRGKVAACSTEMPAIQRLTALAEALDEAVDTWAVGSVDEVAPGPVRKLAKKGGGEVVVPREGGLLVATYDGERDLHACVLRLFQSGPSAGDGKASRRRLLLCCPTTRVSELDMFVQRALGGGRAVHGTFALLHAHTLPHDCRAHLAKSALAARRTRPVNSTALLTLLLPATAHECIGQWQQGGVEVHAIAPLSLDALKGLMATAGGEVQVVSATAAGMGKTTHIRAVTQQRRQGRLHTLGIGDGDTRACLAPRLRTLLRTAGPTACLHIDVGTLEHHREVNTALFELLMLRCLQVGRHVVHLPAAMPVYVEVAHALLLPPVGGTLRAALPVLDAFPETRLEGGVAQLCFDHTDDHGDAQVVCNYLRLLENNQLATTVLHFDGPERNAQVLGREECADLLERHFFAHVTERGGASMGVVCVFLCVLADQLRKFGASLYMHPDHLPDPAMRGAIVAGLVLVSRDLATRCVDPARQRQQGADRRVGPGLELGLLRWEDNHQTFILFHPEGHSLSVLYRRPAHVEPRLRELLQAFQPNQPLRDLHAMSEKELRAELGQVCGRNDNGANLGSPDYKLTPDNLLKMAMILVRVSAGVPVILMGETGCGKTSLIQFLSAAIGACLRVLNVHAGRSAQDIIDFVTQCEALAEEGGQPVWAFLDEINTCAHLSLLNDVMVHHTLHGRALHRHVTFLAAVNPYRLKPAQSLSVGLDAAQKRSTPDPLSLLVYRVHRLPQSMLDYLWDFGALTPQDEAGYVHTLLSDAPARCGRALAEMVVCCHAFLRAREDRSAVSMRDVRRCKMLVEWFYAYRLNELQQAAAAQQQGLLTRLGEGVRGLLPARVRGRGRAWDVQTQAACEAMILAVALCYRSRLPLPELRREMDAQLAGVLRQHAGFRAMGEEAINAVIVSQQRQWAEKMQMGPGVALNEALLENTFVLLVCILLKLPVFLVGKPGSSKTLAMKRIEANLRGRDSADPWWRTLGEVKVVSYQGSESSTSEGVLQAFDKAQSYAQASHSNANVVVLLDEVGLAEISRSNPLKVLHAKLELHDLDRAAEGVEGGERLAVVGMSNWCLDASKMNRALHIARPEPDAAQLLLTAQAIFESLGGRLSEDVTQHLQGLADAYLAYCDDLRVTSHAHFHGLRDWYWAVKLLARGVSEHGRLRPEDLARAVMRNFSGLEHGRPSALQDYVDDAAASLMGPSTAACGPREAVVANLRDADCRHLLLLSPHGEAMLGLLPRLFAEAGRPPPCVLLGSRLPGDQCEAYSYRLLSQIIQFLEMGRCVVLKDLGQLYGSLYDCLNMAYTTVAGRKHCRVALGAYSNPLCHVEDGVRIVVLVDQEAAPSMDPPFLSRFEKQRLSFHALLDPPQRLLAERLAAWVQSMTTTGFGVRDTFTGLSDGSIDALLALCPELSSLEEGKARLLRLASADGMVRALQAQQADGETYCRLYLEDEGHANLPAYLRAHVAPHRARVFRAVVTTFTCLPLFRPDERLLSAAAGLGEGRVWAHRLGAVDSEAALADVVQAFFEDTGHGLLLLECDAALHKDHMLLARFLVDREAATYEAGSEEVKESEDTQLPRKVVIFLTQVKRGPGAPWEACVSHQWDSYHIDDLLLTDAQYRELAAFRHTPTLREVLDREGVFEDLLQSELLGCVCRLRYPRGLSDPEVDVAGRMLQIVEALRRDQGGLLSLMKEKILPLAQAGAGMGPPGAHWLVGVARDVELLSLSSFSLANAVRQRLALLLRGQVTRLVHGLEQASALDTYLQSTPTDHSPTLAAFARAAFLSDAFLPLKPTAQAPLLPPLEVVVLGLRFPFSRCLYRALAPARALHADAVVDDDVARGHCRARVSAILRAQLSGLTSDPVGLWSEDGRLLHDLVTLTVASDSDGVVSPPLLTLCMALVGSAQAGGELGAKLLLLWDHLPRLSHVAALLTSNGTDPEVAAQALQAQGDVDTWALDHCAAAAWALVHDCCATLDQAQEVERLLQKVGAVMGPHPPGPPLLEPLCLLKVLQDMAPLFEGTQLPFTAEQGLRMDEATLDRLQAWLTSLPGESETGRARAAVLDRFLYFALEDSEGMGRFGDSQPLAHPLLLSVCGHVCRLAQAPPVCLSLVLEPLMEEVEAALHDAGSSPRRVICDGNLPQALHPVLRPLEAIMTPMVGSPLEVMLLDVLDRLPSLATPSTVEAECLVFDRALDNAIGEAEGRALSLFPRLYSHAVLRRGLRSVAEPLGRGQSAPEILELRQAVDRGLGRAGTTDTAVGLLHSLRLFYLKSLHMDVASLRAALLDASEATGWQARWMLDLDWQTAETRVRRLGFNPFVSDAYRGAAEAWDALHCAVPPNPEPMTALVDRAIAGLAESGGGEGAAAAALVQAGFMRVHDAGHSHVDPRAEEQLRRLAEDDGVGGRMGRMGLACLHPLPRLQGQEEGVITLLHSLCVRVMGEAACHPAHVLSGYVLAPPQDLSRWMVLGAQSDETANVLAALGELTSRYQCACGHMYVLGACGKVTHAFECSQCGLMLGGHEYDKPAEGQRRLDPEPTMHAPAQAEVAGYLFSPHCLNPDVDHSERSLSPTHYRLLALLVHAALCASSLSGGEEGLRVALTSTPGAGPLAGPTVAQHCLTVMHACLTRLRQSILPQGAGLDLLGAWLHDVVGAVFEDATLAAAGPCTTSDQRRAVESAFAALCTPRLEDVVATAGGALERYAEVTVPLIEKELAELCPPSTTAHCLRAYRLTCQPSRETLQAAFYRHAQTREAYPLVDIFLRHSDRLARLRHLLPIVTWTNAVRKARSRQLSREQARALSHVSLWQRGQEESKAADQEEGAAEEEEGLTREAFERFQEAWNAHRAEAGCSCCNTLGRVRYECKCFELWPMDASLPLLSSCVNVQEEDEGRAAAGIFDEAAKAQNDFLQDCADHGALSEWATVPVQQAKADMLVQVEGLWEGLQRYGRCRLGFGAGHEVEYDWGKVSRHVAQCCIHGKARLSMDELQAFAFVGEAFSVAKTLLMQVEERVAQTPLPDKAALSREARLRGGHEVSSKVLPLLQSVMHMLVTVRGPLNPGMTLADFAHAWLDHAGRYAMASCPSALRNLCLCHVESLYEHLEDTIADSILPHIPEAYAQPLPPVVLEGLGGLVQYAGGLAAFEAAWVRFIIRHLRRPHPLPVEGSLGDYASLLRWAHRGDVSDQAELASVCEALKLGMAMSVLAEVRRRREEEEKEAQGGLTAASGITDQPPGTRAQAASGITDQPPGTQAQARAGAARQAGGAKGGGAARRSRGLNV